MYASGFVIRKLRRKYVKIFTPLAAEVTETLVNLLKGGRYEDKDTSLDEFLCDWFQDVDRGGLNWSVLLLSFQGLPILGAYHDHLKSLWSTVAIDITKESSSDLLLRKVVDCWVTI